ncbi:MAG: hypothetical protein AAGI28_07255 [Pseudomonadota bacterium]
MKRQFVSVLLIPLLLGGCATTHVFRVQPPETVGLRQPAKVESYFGAVSKSADIDCNGNGIAEVYVKQSFWRSLLSTVTLGAYQDTQLRYLCHPGPNDGAGEFGEAPADEGRAARAPTDQGGSDDG